MAKRTRAEEQLIELCENNQALIAIGSDDADHALLLLGHIGRRAPFLDELVGNACADVARIKAILETLHQRAAQERRAI